MHSITETQKLRNNKFFLLVLLVLSIPLGVLGFEFLNSSGLVNHKIIVLSLSVLGIAIFLWFVLQVSVTVKFSQSSITYTFRLLFVKTQKIMVNDVSSWEIVNHYFYQGLGIHTSFKGDWDYALMPGKALLVNTHDGRTYKFGLNRPEKILGFIKAYWQQNENKMYG